MDYTRGDGNGKESPVANRSSRRCERCSTPLATDNAERLCRTCARDQISTHAAAPVQPKEFWQTDGLKEALANHHIGQVFKAYREAHNPVLTQGLLGNWLGLSQGQISRIERGPTPVHDIAKLAHWTRTLHAPQDYLWFQYSNGTYTSTNSVDKLNQTEIGADEVVQRRQLLKTIGLSAAAVSGRADSPMRAVPMGSRRIGPSDLEVMTEMTDTFRRLDNRFGGGHSRAIVTRYITDDIEPVLKTGNFPSAIKRDLFAAAAELYQLGGWMAYDMGDLTAGRSYLQQALRLCQEVRNDALAAEMLAGLSHHAAFNRIPETAVDLALAARQAAARAGVANLHSEVAVLEAHGLALQGNARGTIAALQRAERLFVEASAQSTPTWLNYFDEAYLSAKFAHALRDLGRPSDAERFARQSLEMSDGYERGRLFNTALLASVLADQGKVEEAISNASLALQMAGTMCSSRITTYLEDTATRLLPFGTFTAVRSLHGKMKAAGIAIRRGSLPPRQQVQ